MKRLAVSMVAALLATPTFAEDYYVGASLGVYSYEEAGFKIGESSVGLYGGWNVLPNIAVEGQWINWSGGSDILVPSPGASDTFKLDSVSAFAIYAKPSLTISDGFDIYAKLGIARSTAEAEFTQITPVGCPFVGGCQDIFSASGTVTKTDTVWGVGGEYNLPNALGLRAEVVGFNVSDGSAYTYLVSAHFRFD